MRQLYHHASRIYAAMEKEASDGVYDGFLTRLVLEELGIPVPTYSHSINALKAMGCVEQIRRGGGPLTSQWRLLKPPSESEFAEAYPSNTTRLDALEAEIKKLKSNAG